MIELLIAGTTARLGCNPENAGFAQEALFLNVN
jgi:hypothetical protein